MLFEGGRYMGAAVESVQVMAVALISYFKLTKAYKYNTKWKTMIFISVRLFKM